MEELILQAGEWGEGGNITLPTLHQLSKNLFLKIHFSLASCASYTGDSEGGKIQKDETLSKFQSIKIDS